MTVNTETFEVCPTEASTKDNSRMLEAKNKKNEVTSNLSVFKNRHLNKWINSVIDNKMK